MWSISLSIISVWDHLQLDSLIKDPIGLTNLSTLATKKQHFYLTYLATFTILCQHGSTEPIPSIKNLEIS